MLTIIIKYEKQSHFNIIRPGYGKFDIKNIDTSLCTHGFYGFADLNNQTGDPHIWELVAYDPW